MTKTANTKKTAAKNERIYRDMSEPFMTIAGDNDTETTLNATVVAAIDPKTETKTYSFAVKRGTTGVKNDGTEWRRWTSVTLPLEVDVLDAMIERITKIRDQITEKGTQGGKAYKLNAKDVQFMQQMQGDDDDTPAEPKAAKGKKDTRESAPAAAAVDDDVAKTASWLVENAGKVVNGEKFIKHLIKAAEAYGGKGMLQKAGNVLAAKYGKDKLMGQPAIETIAAHITALFFKPETKPETKPAAKKPVVNMPPALEDDEDGDGSNTPAKPAKPKGKPATIDLADDLDDLEDLIGDLEL
jgi:hypothetical protein